MMVPINLAPPKSFAAQFRAMREQSGLSRRSVAKAAGISSAFLTDIEHGRRMPSRDVVAKLAVAIDRPVADLLRFDHRESLGEILTLITDQPEIALVLAKLCRQLQSGHINQKALERLTQE